MLPSSIRRLSIETLDIPLREPFGISGGAQEIAANLLVGVHLADGTVGIGEAAPFPAFNGETQASTRAALEAVRAQVEGADVHAYRRLAATLKAAIPEAGAARCAIETAVLDALTRRAKVPLWAFFGGVETALRTDITITTGTEEHARQAASRHAATGFDMLKIKIGGSTQEADLARIAAVTAAAPECALILDANGGLTAEATLDLLARARDLGARVALLEQPVPREDLEGMREVVRRAGVDVAADESLTSAAEAVRLAAAGAATVLNLKPMKHGLVEALDIAAVGRAAGLGLMIGGLVESVLAMTTSACLAAGLGGFRFVDLDTPLFLAENPFTGGFAQRGPHLDLSGIDAGHGVRSDRLT
ncbi:dipeptide epimerase [Chondromyces apiculatus]|uniref:Dipeptide epimerase n=1 Tax=Chondromyces apiculatus DSM 436 TaxID=1192034 RepID=A0A017T6B2_9BACT|nr:dipeptide epimerase [Chondromyces apiculatus]EYF04340.1 L-alanine-DL-glutamate epimerase [Chondromyces apiculatus DSM 436]